MAAAATYIIKSVTFKGVAVDGVEEVSYNEDGDVVTHTHDGLATATATFVDAIKGSVRITGRNMSLSSNANLAFGSNGSLVVVFQKRAAGKGAAAGADKTLTAADATITKCGGSAGTGDRSTFELELQCVDPAGSSAFAWT